MSTFSSIAKAKALDLYNNHSHEVGRVLKEQLPELYKDYESTDCITYALKVLSHTYTALGNNQLSDEIWTWGKETPHSDFRGTILAKRLIQRKNWVGIYVSPESIHPKDSDEEHTFAAAIAKARCTYSPDGVPLKHRVVNYNPTKSGESGFQDLYPSFGESKLNNVDYKTLEKIPFGIGLSRGGSHCWVFVEGKVYEVHWNQIGAGLYERGPLKTFRYYSSAIIVPPDTATTLALKTLKCAIGSN